MRPLICLAATLALALTPPASGNQGGGDPAKSTHLADTQVKVVVNNPTGAPLSTIWVDFEGAERDYGSIPSGASTELQTFPGHLWLFKQGGKTLGRYRATQQPQQAWTAGAAQTPPAPAPTPAPAPSPTPVPSGSTKVAQSGSQLSTAQAQEFLDYHNDKRREVGVPSVTWSTELSAEAQAWADHMARTGQFEHRPRQGANATQNGENLGAGFGGGYQPLSAAKDWYGEKKLYVAGSPVTMNTYLKVGHYTQMVWRGTTEIGAGVAIGKSGDLKGWTIVVCNYNPPGNMIGQPPY